MIHKRGVGERQNIHGAYRLFLNDAGVTFVKVGSEQKSHLVELPVSSLSYNVLIKSLSVFHSS